MEDESDQKVTIRIAVLEVVAPVGITCLFVLCREDESDQKVTILIAVGVVARVAIAFLFVLCREGRQCPDDDHTGCSVGCCVTWFDHRYLLSCEKVCNESFQRHFQVCLYSLIAHSISLK